jgi:hypothetical protein
MTKLKIKIIKKPDQIGGVRRRSMTSPNTYPDSLRWGCGVFEHLEREREREVGQLLVVGDFVSVSELRG